MESATGSNLDHDSYSLLMAKIRMNDYDKEKVRVEYFTHSTLASVQRKVKVEGVLRGYPTDLPSRSPLAQNLELKGIWVEAHSDLYTKRSPYGTRRIIIKSEDLMKYLTTCSYEEIEKNLKDVDKKCAFADIEDDEIQDSDNSVESDDNEEEKSSDEEESPINEERSDDSREDEIVNDGDQSWKQMFDNKGNMSYDITREIDDRKITKKFYPNSQIRKGLDQRISNNNETQDKVSIEDNDEINQTKSLCDDRTSEDVCNHEIQVIQNNGVRAMSFLDGPRQEDCGQNIDESISECVLSEDNAQAKRENIRKSRTKKDKPKAIDLSLAQRYHRKYFLKDEILIRQRKEFNQHHLVSSNPDSNKAEIPYFFFEGAHFYHEKQYARFVLISASHHFVDWCHKNLKPLDVYRNPFFQYNNKTRQVLSSACIVNRGKRALFMEILIVGDIMLDHLDTPPHWDRVKKLRRAGGHPRLGVYVKRK